MSTWWQEPRAWSRHGCLPGPALAGCWQGAEQEAGILTMTANAAPRRALDLRLPEGESCGAFPMHLLGIVCLSLKTVCLDPALLFHSGLFGFFKHIFV